MVSRQTHTLISLVTLKEFSYPAYEKIILYMAVVAPYGVILPLNGSEKFARGSATLVWPPRTTSPVMEMKRRVTSLTMPMPLDSQYEYFVWKESTALQSDLMSVGRRSTYAERLRCIQQAQRLSVPMEMA